jgi:hypothetical protein
MDRRADLSGSEPVHETLVLVAERLAPLVVIGREVDRPEIPCGRFAGADDRRCGVLVDPVGLANLDRFKAGGLQRGPEFGFR